MIPKIIHYCWFGEAYKNQSVLTYIDSWKKFNPNFEIIEWNENNFDISINDYVKEAYRNKKWAFVSDYARLYALYNYGGIYLDTDVEVIKPFDSLLNTKTFMGAESQFSICTATIGAEKGSELIKEIMQSYEGKHFFTNNKMDTMPNSQRIFHILSDHYKYKHSVKDIQDLDVCIIYPQDFFSPINCYTFYEEITERTICIHRYAGTWKNSREKLKDKGIVFLTRIIGENLREKIKRTLKKY